MKILKYGYEECSSDKEVVRFISPYYMIHYVEKGHGYFNGVRLGEGDGFVCMKDEMCEYYPDRNDPWTYTWFDPVGDDADAVISMLQFEELPVFKWEKSELHELRRMCEKSLEESSPADELIRISAFYTLMAKRIKGNNINEGNSYVKKAMEYIERNSERKISAQNIADELHISRAYLRNLFYEETGMSTQEYIMKMRMERAGTLLSQQQFGVGEVAVSVGYGDVMQFSKIFKKYFGVSPSHYKKADN